MLDRTEIEKKARELRREETRRLAIEFTTWLTISLSERLRGHHETWLRRPRAARMRSVNATPA